jgi:hypothetical protein
MPETMAVELAIGGLEALFLLLHLPDNTGWPNASFRLVASVTASAESPLRPPLLSHAPTVACQAPP